MKKTPNLPDTDEMESALLANIRARQFLLGLQRARANRPDTIWTI